MPDSAESGTSRRRLFVVLCVIATLAVLSVSACLLTFHFIRPEISQDPSLVRGVQQQILEVEMPGDWEPAGTIKWTVPLFLSMRGTYYRLPAKEGMLVLMELSGRGLQSSQAQERVREVLNERGAGGTGLNSEGEVKQKRELRIGGEMVSFNEREGQEGGDKRRYRQLDGVIRGKAGQVLVLIRMPADRWDEEVVNQFVSRVRGG